MTRYSSRPLLKVFQGVGNDLLVNPTYSVTNKEKQSVYICRPIISYF